MIWMMNYAVSSTLLAALVILIDRRLRPGWRESFLWLSLFAPIVIASAGLIGGGAPVSTSLIVAPVISVETPLAIGTASAADLGIAWLVISIWLAGVVLLGTRDVVKHRRLMKLLDRTPVAKQDIIDLAERLHLVKRVRFTASESLPVPIAIGSREVCLPSYLLNGANLDSLEPIIAHELCHLRRKDPSLQLIARLLSIVFWWQPLNRVVARRLQSVAELRTDRLGAERVGPARLARALVGFAQQSHSRQLAGLPAFAAGLLNERVSHLLREPGPQSRLRLRIAVCGVVATFALLLAPRFAVLRAQLPAMLNPLIVNASQLTTVTSKPAGQKPAAQIATTATQMSPRESRPGSTEVLAALARLLDDREQHVRAAARESLRRIDSPESRAVLANDGYSQIDSSKERK